MELGYAVIDEIIYETIKNNWIEPLAKTNDPTTTLQQLLIHSGELMCEESVRLGCPLNNLAQEMSPNNEGFRGRITLVYKEWINALDEAFETGKSAGNVNSSVESKQTALLLFQCLKVAWVLPKQIRA